MSLWKSGKSFAHKRVLNEKTDSDKLPRACQNPNSNLQIFCVPPCGYIITVVDIICRFLREMCEN